MRQVDNSQPSDASMILLMGVTGSGKSYFINQLAERKVVTESSHLDSCTQVCIGIPVEIGRSKVLLIDTPGFDDSARSDTEILTEISKLLAAQYKLGVSLKGIIYLHRITDVRFQGSSVKTLTIFKEICGEASLRNVILASTRWDKVNEAEGAGRERELRDKFWSYMIGHGSSMTRYHGDRESAVAMVSQLLGSASIVLDLQRQIVDEGKTLDQTSAGVVVNGELTEHIAQSKRNAAEIQALRKSLKDSEEVQRRQMEVEQQREEYRLRQAEKDQVRLRTDIATEVRQELELEMAKTRKKSSKMGIIAPLLPTALAILGSFIGIPTSMTGLFSSWIVGGDDGGGFFDTLSELFDM